MDASRFWVQVKGTKRLKQYAQARTGVLVYRVRVEQALRWLRSADPVFVVLWDITDGVGVWASVGTGFSEWDLIDRADGKKISVRFHPHDVLNRGAAKLLGWIARVQRYESLVLRSQAQAAFVPGGAASKIVEFEELTRTSVIIGLDFLTDIGIVASGPNDRLALPSTVTQSVAEEIDRQLRRVGSRDQPSVEHALGAAAATVILDRCPEGLRLPTPLLIAGCEALRNVFEMDPRAYEERPAEPN